MLTSVVRSMTVVLLAGLAGCAGEDPGGVPLAAPPPGASVAPAVPTATASPPAPATSPARVGMGPRPSTAAPPSGGSSGRGCGVFPADNVLRADVSRLPVHAKSSAWVASIGAGRNAHPDFGSGLIDGAPFGIPVTAVPPGQKAARVTIDDPSESDKGPYRIPPNARIEGGASGGGDRHVLAYDRAACKVYELYAARRNGDGSWRADAGAIFDLRSNKLRPAGWTSADAAGLSIFAGLIRYEEVAAGRIDHAIRITAPRTRDAYIWPARHSASNSSDPALPPMGARFRLKASVDISGFPPQARVIAKALQKYGAVLADNGSAWYLTGSEDRRWNNDALGALKRLQGSDFEAVDVSGLMVNPNSGAVRR